MRVRRNLILGLFASAASLATASPSYAEAASGGPATADEARPTGTLEDLVVTARRRSESFQDVPAMVSVVSQEAVERYHVTALETLVNQIPAVMIANVPTSGANLTIRGIGVAGNDFGLEQSVIVNIDNVQTTRGRVISQSFFDLQQVEAVKGPQALYFGRNSSAGVISVTSLGPTRDFRGYGRAGYEFNARERYLEGAVSGPLNENIGARLAFHYSDADGWLRNDAQPTGNVPAFVAAGVTTSPGAAEHRQRGGKDYAARLTLDYQDGGPFDATLKVFAGRQESDVAGGQEPKCTGEHPVFIFGATTVLTQNDCKLNGKVAVTAFTPAYATDPAFSTGRDGKPFATTETVLASLVANYQFGGVKLTSTTGYYAYETKSLDAYYVNEMQTNLGNSIEKSPAFTQELRLASDFSSPLNFQLGAFYARSNRKTNNGVILLAALDPVRNSYYQAISSSTSPWTAYSVFGQLTWRLSPDLELAGGARYSEDHIDSTKNSDYVNQFNSLRTRVAPQGVVDVVSIDEHNTSPEVTLTYRPSENLTVYGAYKTGYKAGGAANPSLFSPNLVGTRAFKAETSDGFEVGAKALLLSHRLRLNAAVYSYQFANLQVSAFNSSLPAFVITNAASARTRGFELEAVWQASAALQLRSNIAYTQARYRRFPNAQCPNDPGVTATTCDFSGARLPFSPDWTVAGGITFDQPVGSKLVLSYNADATYLSSYYTQANLTSNARQDGFLRLEASVVLHDSDRRWEVALIGRNLTNEYYGVWSNDAPFGGKGQNNVVTGRPREIRVQVTHQF